MNFIKKIKEIILELKKNLILTVGLYILFNIGIYFYKKKQDNKIMFYTKTIIEVKQHWSELKIENIHSNLSTLKKYNESFEIKILKPKEKKKN